MLKKIAFLVLCSLPICNRHPPSTGIVKVLKNQFNLEWLGSDIETIVLSKIDENRCKQTLASLP